MKLWIRSQDKEEIIQIIRLFVKESYANYEICANVNSGFAILGEYKTKERALEILDEIMNLLEQEEFFHIRKSSLNNLDEIAEPKYILKPVGNPKVYRMPKE